MEWLEQFKGKVVGLDTAPLIYFIEQNPNYLKIVREFFSSIDQSIQHFCNCCNSDSSSYYYSTKENEI